MEWSDVVRRRRMVRSFAPEPGPLDRALVAAVVGAGRRAPSAGGTRGWAFVVLEGDARGAFWEATTTADWRASSRRWPGLAAASAIVVVLASPDAYLRRYGEPDKASSGLGPNDGPEAWPIPYWFFDAGGVVALMLGTAVDLGLAACFLGNFRGERDLLGALGVPGDWRYVGAVLLGQVGGLDRPSASVGRRPRDADLVFRGRWGQESIEVR